MPNPIKRVYGHFRHSLAGPDGSPYRIEGTPDETTFLRGDQRWWPLSTINGGSGTTGPFDYGLITDPATVAFDYGSVA